MPDAPQQAEPAAPPREPAPELLDAPPRPLEPVAGPPFAGAYDQLWDDDRGR